MSLTPPVLTVPRKPWRSRHYRRRRQLIFDQSLATCSASRAGAADPIRPDGARPIGAGAIAPPGGRPATPRRARRARAAASSLVDVTVPGPLFARGPKADAHGGRG